MLTTFPATMQFFIGIPETLSQNHICHHWLSESWISKIMHCGILIQMPYYHQDRRGSAFHLQQRDSRLAVTAQHCGGNICILQSFTDMDKFRSTDHLIYSIHHSHIFFIHLIIACKHQKPKACSGFIWIGMWASLFTWLSWKAHVHSQVYEMWGFLDARWLLR